ncbi:MAG: imidazoleglycerol-phosphate dehydratase HisB [Thermus sp.]|uniref:Imidazoleglycerol-phosphate dehydratase n=1 Tax=Thermus brevis TaxID=2862456 RepID=A0ABS6ZZR3_9DEIN|nr:imidazoleglycerol-phosphate dehydratase HisB [Thermus brevis]MBW6395523.1 imidazoleglycerol-phosphate dehydratase HisB [Thermus brevis]
MREASVERATAETWVRVHLGLDGPSGGKVATGLPFLDHMLLQLQRHGRFLLEVEAKGDLEVDVHHLVEDVGITLGQALREALGEGRGVERYAEAFAPMDETLVLCVLDLSGRPHLEYRPEEWPVVGEAGGVNHYHLREFLRGLVNHGRLTLHLRLLSGREAHHVVEASFKALARALHRATRITGEELPSTKGVL